MEERKKISKQHIYKRKIDKSNRLKLNLNNKIRNPGIDFLRILGMIDIGTFHIIQKAKKFNKYYKYLKLTEVLTKWHISTFGVISGIVGYKSHKYSNLLYLWLSAVFYSLLNHFFVKTFYPDKVMPNVKLIKYFFPVVFKEYWYITTYFRMYLFLPLINKNISSITKSELFIINLSIFGILFIWRDLMQDESEVNNKFYQRSALTLLSYYILGSYIGKFVINKNQNRNIFYYLTLISLYALVSYSTYYLRYSGVTISNKALLLLKKLFHDNINSIAMIIETISITLIFTQIKYNKLISKIITYIGPLAFSFYLINSNWDVKRTLYRGLYDKYSYDLPFIKLLLIFLCIVIKRFCISIFIDYFRNLLFKILRIKNICIFIETFIKNKFKKIFKE